MIRRSVLVGIGLLLVVVACGDDDITAVPVDGGTDGSKSADAASDSGSSGGDATTTLSDATPSETGADAGVVTSLYGTFHEGNGGEHNLTINNNTGTWTEQNWLCGGGGGGGGCGSGIVQANGNTLTLLPSGDAGTMIWFSGSVSSVTVTIALGKLHTVTTGAAGGEQTLDVFPGYECYIDCDKGSSGPCTATRQC